MNKYLSLTFSILFVVLITACAVLYSRNNSLENRLETMASNMEKISLGKGPTTLEIAKQNFKEDYYIQQSSKDTNLILFIFGVIVTAFGLVSFKIFDERLSKYMAEENTKHQKHVKKYIDLEKSISVVRSKISLDNSQVNFEKARESLDEKDYYYYLDYSLAGISNEVDFYLWSIKYNDKSKYQTVIDSIISRLEEIEGNIKGQAKIIVPYDLLLNHRISNIRKIKNQAIQKSLSNIHSKIVEEKTIS